MTKFSFVLGTLALWMTIVGTVLSLDCNYGGQYSTSTKCNGNWYQINAGYQNKNFAKTIMASIYQATKNMDNDEEMEWYCGRYKGETGCVLSYDGVWPSEVAAVAGDAMTGFGCVTDNVYSPATYADYTIKNLDGNFGFWLGTTDCAGC
ncbi:hypothetical protein EC973_003352 [Apophysomyces ossiformis]|uniref:Uncharacterized protein n=1 Tax=Apophysomyces ossiformis TaxID=679940 RepID=A0A8H7BT32_9FUNG|nr:hypothetical protein EC973_003352 [Apophysomyces ossiformis]